MNQLASVLELAGWALDAVGLAIVFTGAVIASTRFLQHSSQKIPDSYRLFRQDLGRAILLGLEFLVAGDIIRTVVVDPTIERVASLGGIVLIRTFLSMSLQLEIEGRWPWQRDVPSLAARPEASRERGQ